MTEARSVQNTNVEESNLQLTMGGNKKPIKTGESLDSLRRANLKAIEEATALCLCSFN